MKQTVIDVERSDNVVWTTTSALKHLLFSYMSIY